MICEECGIRQAKFHLVTIANEERNERNLCPVCMAKYQRKLPGIDFSNIAGILSSVLNLRSGQKSSESDERYSDIKCEQCGLTYAEFRKNGMLGCSSCYKAFREPLETLLQQIHGNSQHAGRIPSNVRKDVSIRTNIERLKQQLQRAIQQEEYEKAAKLRDAIRALSAQLAETSRGDIKVKPPERLENGEGGNDDE